MTVAEARARVVRSAGVVCPTPELLDRLIDAADAYALVAVEAERERILAEIKSLSR